MLKLCCSAYSARGGCAGASPAEGGNRSCPSGRAGALASGAAGAVVRDTTSHTADVYVYVDSWGWETYFLGSSNTGSAAGQLWKIVDPAGNTAYVGHATAGSG